MVGSHGMAWVCAWACFQSRGCARARAHAARRHPARNSANGALALRMPARTAAASPAHLSPLTSHRSPHHRPCALHAHPPPPYVQVSFPAFLRVDEDPRKPFTLARAGTEALASGMAVLCLLDFVRLAVGVELFAPRG